MKDAYYFPHDSNAKDDPKCVLLIEEFGLEGYGIFWMLIETLRDQPTFTYPLKLVSALAKRYGADPDIVLKVIKNYELFKIKAKENLFYSVSLNKRMMEIDEKRQKRSKAGIIGNRVRWKDNRKAIASLSQDQSDGIANKENENNIRKLRKVKESKVKQDSSSFDPPDKIELTQFLKERNVVDAELQAEKMFNYYTSKGWLVGRTKMEDWRAAAANWILKDLEIKNSNRTNINNSHNVNEKWNK